MNIILHHSAIEACKKCSVRHGAHAGKYLGEHPMSYSTKSVTLGVFLWLRQAGNMELLCNEVSTIR